MRKPQKPQKFGWNEQLKGLESPDSLALRESEHDPGEDTFEFVLRQQGEPVVESSVARSKARQGALVGLELTQTLQIQFPAGELSQEPCLLFMSGLEAGRLWPLSFDERGCFVIGRDPDCEVSFDSPEISRRHAEVELLEDGTLLLTDMGSKNGTFVNNQRVKRCRLQSSDKVQIGSREILKLVYQDQEEIACWQQLYRHSVTDWLTGVHNRRALIQGLEKEWSFAQRAQIPVSLLVIDIDHFKSVNDTYGHPIGDRVLCGFVERIQKSIRQEDLLARYGGEEFVLMLRQTDRQGAAWQAERLRALIASEPFDVGGQLLKITASIGYVCYLPEQMSERSPQEMIADGDIQLYHAKDSGRNKVCG